MKYSRVYSKRYNY